MAGDTALGCRIAAALFGDKERAPFVCDGLREPRHMLGPVHRAGLAGRDGLRVVPPSQNVQSVIWGRSPELHAAL